MAASSPPEIQHFFYVHRLKEFGTVDFVHRLGAAVKNVSHDYLAQINAIRSTLRELFHNKDLKHVDRELLSAKVLEYISKFYDLAEAAPATGTESSETQHSSLRGSLTFVWTNVYGPERQTAMKDAMFEVASLLFNQVVWWLGYAEYLLTHLEPAEEEQQRKVAYDCLLKAAGLAETLTAMTPNFGATCPVDLRPGLLDSLKQQALSQAQEITIGRAIRQGNSPLLIAKLACDTAAKYHSAFEQLQTAELLAVGNLNKLRQYFKYKHTLFQSYAYYYMGVAMSKEPAYGKAISAATHAHKLSQQALEEAKVYVQTPPTLRREGQRPLADPSQLAERIQRQLAVWQRENEAVFYERVPETPPDLPDPQALVKPSPYTLPSPSAAVTLDTALIKDDEVQQELPSTLMAGGSVNTSAPANSQQNTKPAEKCILA